MVLFAMFNEQFENIPIADSNLGNYFIFCVLAGGRRLITILAQVLLPLNLFFSN